MTREDAKDNILEYYNVFRDLDWQIQDMLKEGVDSRIDEIYDYFEQRIIELEAPKSCDGCNNSLDDGTSDHHSDICKFCTRYGADYYEPKDK